MTNYENLGGVFLDHSELIGYICDTDTYELFYMTKAAMETYGMESPEDYQGQSCHKVLHGLDAPCPFCTNDKLTAEHEHRWNHYNEKLGRWFGSTGRLLMLDGRRCRLHRRRAGLRAGKRFFSLLSRGRCRTSLRDGRFAGSARRQDLPHDPGRNKAPDPCRAAVHSASGRPVVALKFFQYL